MRSNKKQTAVQRFGLDTNKLFGTCAVFFLLPFLSSLSSHYPFCPRFLFLWRLGPPRKFCVKEPSLPRFVGITMKDILGNVDRSGVREKSEFRTEREISCKLGSLVHQSPIVAPLVHILVVVGVHRAAMDGEGGR